MLVGVLGRQRLGSDRQWLDLPYATLPPKQTVPLVLLVSPINPFRSVLFPVPTRPTMQTRLPLGICIKILSSVNGSFSTAVEASSLEISSPFFLLVIDAILFLKRCILDVIVAYGLLSSS